MLPCTELRRRRNQLLLLLLAAATSFLSLSSATSEPSAPPPSNGTTVYDLLPKFGLPRGLLPDTVKSYSLEDDGAFHVELVGPCYVHFDYLVYYDREITGSLKIGGITSLKGIQVRKFLIWLDVDEIKVDLPPSDYIYFQVGWIDKKLPVDQFRTVRSCEDQTTLATFFQAAGTSTLAGIQAAWHNMCCLTLEADHIL